MTDSQDKAVNSIFARSRELIALAARLGRKELGHRVTEWMGENEPLKRVQTQIDQAKLVVDSLGRLKGAAMKMGQLFSLEAADFFPPEVVDILSRLQDQSPPLSTEVIGDILTKELGTRRKDVLNFSPKPIAAASIGQVHSARIGDKKVALKIQYPGVADSIESDVKILRTLLFSLMKIGKREINMDPLFAELTEVLKSEVDYLQEAASTREYRRLFSDDPRFLVPQVLSDYSTSRVLTLEFMEGRSLKEWLATKPTLKEKEHLGRLVLDLYVKEFFEFGYVQTDPNFANFLYQADTQKLVLLDFGATRHYAPDFRKSYSKLLRDIQEGGQADIIGTSLKMGLIQEGESIDCLKSFVKMLKISMEPFNSDRQPFAFGDLDYSKAVREATTQFIKQVQFSPPPHQLIFLHRKLGGIFSLLKVMDVKIDLRPYWERLNGNIEVT